MSCVPARALFHTGPRCVELREVPTPRPAAGEVLVRTVCSGISGGTERLVYRGEVPAELALDETIDALGGELIALPAVDPASATLFPLVETALQVTLDAGTGYRDRVVVLGAGVLGLLTGLLLQRSGWRPLIAEPQEWRRVLASSLGVTTAAPAELVNEKVPLVIDASGNPDAPAMALDMLAHEGTLLVASWFGAKPVVLPLGGAFHRRRLTIRSTQVSTVPARLSATWSRSRRRQETVELLPELPLAQLCTDVFDFGHAAEAFRAVDQGKPGLMHAVLNYDRSAAGDL